jgi:hypothetical protein
VIQIIQEIFASLHLVMEFHHQIKHTFAMDLENVIQIINVLVVNLHNKKQFKILMEIFVKITYVII